MTDRGYPMELPSSAIGTLRLMPAKSDQIAIFSRQLIESVKNGDTNPLELLVILRALESVSKVVRDEIHENIMTAADKYSEKTIEAFGAKIEKREVNTRYNYASAKDVEWERMDAEIKSLTDRIKEREKFLRALKEPMTVVDKETGEVTEIHPPMKTSESGLAVYLK